MNLPSKAKPYIVKGHALRDVSDPVVQRLGVPPRSRLRATIVVQGLILKRS